jgi:hypothetical protein
MRSRTAAAALVVLLQTSRAGAHHEAIFGPQSALLSADRVVSAQLFTRQTGPKGERVQETTMVLSGGLSPTRAPLSVSFVLPFSGVRRDLAARRETLERPHGQRALPVGRRRDRQIRPFRMTTLRRCAGLRPRNRRGQPWRSSRRL